jgi:hypothetical protein
MRKTILAGALSAGLVAAFAAAGPASAATIRPGSSGGGCSGSSAAGYGWAFSSCISASNGTVYPDGYVTAVGTKGTSCIIEVALIKNGVDIGDTANSCNSTHLVGIHATGSGSYFTGIYAVINGTTDTAEVISPYEYN